MKHTLPVTVVLISVFLVAQVMGLYITSAYINIEETKETGEVAFDELPLGMERPEVEEGSSLIILVVMAIIIGTLLLLLLIKLNFKIVWKLWFLLAVVITLIFSLKPLLKIDSVVLLLAIGLAIWKVFKPNIIVHNITEIFIYGGLAAIFVPVEVMNVVIAAILLLIISAYDMYAVWKSKHMVKLATFQSESKVFAGLFIPYKVGKKVKSKKKENSKKVKKGTTKAGILGGGDIGFPLLFTGVVMKSMVLSYGIWEAFARSLIVVVFATTALALLFVYSKKNRFYPAMPFLTAGCFIGYGVLYLVNLI